jgi:hypothetical protein
MAVTNAITDLFKSVYELLASILGAAYTIVHSFVSGVLSLFAGFFAFVGDIGKGVFDLVGGVGKFVAGTFAPFAHVPLASALQSPILHFGLQVSYGNSYELKRRYWKRK